MAIKKVIINGQKNERIMYEFNLVLSIGVKVEKVRSKKSFKLQAASY